MDVVGAIAHIPTLQTNEWIDSARAMIAIWSGMLLLPMLVVGQRTKNYGFYALSIFVFLTAVNEADQIGQPFIIYQLPLRALGCSIATFWMWKRRNSSKA